MGPLGIERGLDIGVLDDVAVAVDAGLVAEGRSGRDAVYTLPDAARVVRLLVSYRTGFVDRMVDGFLAGADALR